jgi:23S rRNA pseudouridine2605 synthase
MAQPFKKFMGQGDSGAKKKERIRQEKKKVRAETKEFFEKKKQEAREARAQGQATGYQSDRGRMDHTSRNEKSPNFKPQGSSTSRGKSQGSGYKKASGYPDKSGNSRGKAQGTGYKSSRPADARNSDQRPASGQRFEKKPAAGFKKGASYKPTQPAGANDPERRPVGKQQGFEKKPVPGIKPTRPAGEDNATNYKPRAEKRASSFKPTRPGATGKGNEKTEGNRKPTISLKPSRPVGTSNTGKAESYKPKAENNTGKFQKGAPQPEAKNEKPETAVSGSMPLNKFIAHAGICSRRDAAEMVKAGKVIVNGDKIIEPGHKVTDKDEVKINGKKLFARRNLVYILLNKPKDFITTTEDPQGRKTVMDIVRNATPERVYPIGRLDRNTTGVLLLTNDGELAQKLSHPSYEIRKIYEVKLDKVLTKKDFDTIMSGITLEDGLIMPDLLAYADPKDKSIIGIEIHSGRNRIVRRIFEHLGYDVRNLDRVMYANLTKKNVDRGKWRFLSEKEVRLLKYLNSSYTKNKTVDRG